MSRDPYERWLRGMNGAGREQILGIDPAIMKVSDDLMDRTWEMVKQVWAPERPWRWPKPYQWRVSPDVRTALGAFLDALDPTWGGDLIYWGLHVIADHSLPPNSIILEAIEP